jgi:hypothetical protein
MSTAPSTRRRPAATPYDDRWRAVPGRAVRLLSDLRSGKRHYSTSWVALLRRLAYLHSHGGFLPREALQAGLLDPRLTESALAATIAKESLLAIQARVNPRRLECLTEDKAIFYAYCSALGLPVPRLLGVAARPVGFSADGRPLRDAADWRAFAAGLPDEFVVKPSRGVYGWGVEVFRRDGAGFAGSSSGRHSADDMSTACFTDPRFSSYVIQERLHGHSALRELSGTPFLQTVRIVTDVDEEGTSRVSTAYLRIIAGEAVVDNYDHGRTGNLCSLVDPADGTLDPALGAAPDGIGFVRVAEHPRTRVPFERFHLPDWEVACALARRAAVLFLPLRTLGWDVALTSDGPRLVEANMWWDPANNIGAATPRPATTVGLIELLERLRKAPRRR